MTVAIFVVGLIAIYAGLAALCAGRTPQWEDYYVVTPDIVTHSNPPRVRYYIRGTWPRNLVSYGSFPTQEGAVEWAKEATRALTT